MATVHWPGGEAIGRFDHLRPIPYLLTGAEDYPDGINAFIYERVRGSLPGRVNAEPRFILKPLGKHAASKLAYNLCDVLTWLETSAAHPQLGVIDWRLTQPWHITELYMDAMLLGFWSENYWATRTPAPLAPATARERVGEALRCFSWCAQSGYSTPFNYEPDIRLIQRSKDDALLSYQREMIALSVEEVPLRIRPIRKQPANLPLPSLEHLSDFFAAIPKGAARRAVRHSFETGMRCDEVVQNTLIPGRLHCRSDIGTRHPSWPRTSYMLKYSLSDDRMLGVIPTEEMAWSAGARFGYQCEYRILGKGPKIRKVALPPEFVQSLWAHIAGRHRSSSPYVYLNRDGEPLSYHAIWEACNRANKKLKAPLDITPHVLRHAYACYFLEISIVTQAKKQGYSPDSIPASFLNDFGTTVLLLIKQQLGHSELRTTQRYLDQLASGYLGLTYHRIWNSFLDGTRDQA
jgi:integrase